MKNYLLENKKIVLLLFAIFSYLLTLNILMPPQSDDYHFAIIAQNGLKSAVDSYFNWNARFGEMLFVSFVAALPQYIFNPLNALVGTIFIVVIFALIFARAPKNDDLYTILLFSFCILFFMPFGSDFLWGAGSLNYLWAFVFLVFCLLPYRFFWADSKSFFAQPLVNYHFFLAFFPFMFFAGMVSELIGVIVIIALLASLSFPRFLKNKITIFYVLGILVFILGYLALYFSPAVEIRIGKGDIYDGTFLSISELLNLTLSEKYYRIIETLRFAGTQIVLFLSSFLIMFLFFKKPHAKFVFLISLILLFNTSIFLAHALNISLLIYFIKTHRSKTSIAVAVIYALYLLANLAIIQMLFLPFRAHFGEVLFIISIFLILFSTIKINKIHKIILSCALIFYASFVLVEYISFFNRWNNMVEFVKSEKARGNLDVVAPNIFYSHYKHFANFPLPTDFTNAIPNPVYAREFGLNSFKIDDFYAYDNIFRF